MNKILLIGGGGHCKSIIDVIEQENKFSIAGIIDRKDLIGENVLDYKIIGSDDDLVKLREKYSYAIVSVGQIKTSIVRSRLFKLLKEIDYKVPTIISPFSYVSKYSFIDEGSVVMHHALINAGSRIGKNCIINTKALIEHDVSIEDNCHISTGATINGGSIIKKNTFFGSHSMARENIIIDNNKIVGAGKNIMNNLLD